MPPSAPANRNMAANRILWTKPAFDAVQFIKTARSRRSGWRAAKVAPIIPPQELPTK